MGGLASCIFVAPLFMGGRHPLGVLVLATLVCFTLCACLIEKAIQRGSCWRFSGAEAVILGGFALLLLQMTPLPATWIHKLSPTVHRLAPITEASAEPTSKSNTEWPYISLAPQETRQGFLVFTAYALLFLVTVQHIQKIRDVENILTLIAFGVVAMSALGILQMCCGNGKILWVYEHPFFEATGSAQGPFSNHNHFAHYLALGVGALAWLAFRPDSKRKKRKRSDSSFGVTNPFAGQELNRPVMILACTGFVALAGLLSQSRGGVAAMALAGMLVLTLYYFLGTIDKTKLFIAIGTTTCVALIGLAVWGVAGVLNRVDETLDAENVTQVSPGRGLIWSAVLRAAPDFALVGSGFGSHHEVYSRYFEGYSEVEYSHAESEYMQVLLEGGACGVTLVVSAILLAGFWCLRLIRYRESARFSACAGAVVTGIAVSLAHASVDFVWHIPACMTLALLLLGCACRLYQISYETEQGRQPWRLSLPRPAWGAGAIACLVVCGFVAWHQTAPALAALDWDRYMKLAASKKVDMVKDDTATREDRIASLKQVVAQDPYHSRARLQLASMYVRSFEEDQQTSTNAIPLEGIRDAALASEFASADDLQKWVNAATEGRMEKLLLAQQHARRSIQLCPMQGEAYVILSRLAFLDNQSQKTQETLLLQALRVRPHSAFVNFEVGRIAFQKGNAVAALRHFRLAFIANRELQHVLVETFAGNGIEFLENAFPMELNHWQGLQRFYHSVGAEQEKMSVAKKQANMLEQLAIVGGDDAADLWWERQEACLVFGDIDEAIRSAQAAVEADSSSFTLRRDTAKLLIEHKHYSEAIPHLSWCLLEQPENKPLQAMLHDAYRGEEEMIRLAAMPPEAKPLATTTAEPTDGEAVSEVAPPEEESKQPAPERKRGPSKSYFPRRGRSPR